MWRALLGLFCGVSAFAAERPNIVVLLADDLGIGDVSCYNPHSAWRTPNLDRFAQDGMRFTDAHAASSLCTPSRYALLTGRYAWRGELKQGVLNGYSSPLIESGRPTIAAFLRQRGYATAMFGKWHLGLGWSRRGAKPEDVDFAQPFANGPLTRGFDRFLGLSASLDMPPYVWLAQDRATMVPTHQIGDSPPPKLWRGGPIADDFKMEEVQPRLTAEAIRYLGERAAAHDGQPFFLYVPFAAPHTPILPVDGFAGKTGATSYGDFVTQVDADVGKILAALERHGFAQNTLVIFTSDNGFAPAADLEAHARIHHDPSGGYRGYKSDLFEGGHRIPFLARWPGKISAGATCADLIGQLDLFATCAELLGTMVPASAAEDSISFLSLLRGEKNSAARRTTMILHSGEGRFTIRDGHWKLLLWPGSGGWSPPTPNPSQWLKTEAADLSQLPPFQLYDLVADPAEKNNVAAAHPEIVQRLGQAARRAVERDGKPAVTWTQTSWVKSFTP